MRRNARHNSALPHGYLRRFGLDTLANEGMSGRYTFQPLPRVLSFELLVLVDDDTLRSCCSNDVFHGVICPGELAGDG